MLTRALCQVVKAFLKYLFIRVAIDWVHHFLALSLSLTYITSPYFVSFRFALRSSPLCSRPPDVYVYVSSTQFIARCRSARACYRYSQCLSLCKRGGPHYFFKSRSVLLFPYRLGCALAIQLLLVPGYYSRQQEIDAHI